MVTAMSSVAAQTGSTGCEPGCRVEVHPPRGRLASCLLEPKRELHWGEVHDLSRTGIGLIMDRAFQPETPMVIHLTRARRSVLAVPSLVKRAELDPSGSWTISCQFEQELGDEELQDVL
jgi:hypothetical protein